MDEDKLLIILREHTERIEKSIAESYKNTADCFISSVMPQFEDRMEEISKCIAIDTAKKVCQDLTGEEYDDRTRVRVVREAVQWSIKSSKKSIIASNTMLTTCIAVPISIISGLILHILKG